MDEPKTRRKSDREKRPEEMRDERVVRRPRSERKALPDELLEFARSDEMRLRMPPKERSPHLLDPRVGAPVPGVSNRDARDVLGVHEKLIDELLADREAEGADDALAQELAILVATGMYRARNFIDFEAYATAQLGLDVEEARRLADEGAEALGFPPGHVFGELTVAAFFRAEAALHEAGIHSIVGLALDESDGSERLLIDLDGVHAARALRAIGGRMTPIASDQEKLRERAEERARRWEASRAPAWENEDVVDEPGGVEGSDRASPEGIPERGGFAPPRPKKKASEDRRKRSFDEKGGMKERDRYDDRRSFKRPGEERGGFRGREGFDDRRGPGRRDRFDDRRGFKGREEERGGFKRRDRFDDRRGFKGADDDRGGSRGRERFEDRGSFRGRERFDDRRGPGRRDRFDDRRGFKGPDDDRRGFKGPGDDRRGPGRRGEERHGGRAQRDELYTAKSRRFKKK